MITLLQYPQTDSSNKLREQIISLQSYAWPLAPNSNISDTIWPSNPELHITSLVLEDDHLPISHVAVLGKNITHKNESYLAFGLSEVVTNPSYRRQGFGLKLTQEAFTIIKHLNPDISIFTCNPSLISFYEQGGWKHIDNVCLVGGTHNNPFRSDSLGLSTMMYFFSDKAKEHINDFYNSDVYLELKEKQLW